MKTILTLLILFSLIASLAHSELSETDLNSIRVIVTEQVKKEMTQLTTNSNTLKTDIAVIQTEFKNLKETIDTGFSNVETRFDSIEKNFDRLNSIIIACIGIPLAILAIGATVWGYWYTDEAQKISHSKNRFKA